VRTEKKKFIGVWKLDKPICCTKEVSGKCFQSNIAGVSVSFFFSSCPETYIPTSDSLSKGNLIAPLNITLFQNKINWGMIHAWPEGLFSVNFLLCIWIGNEPDAPCVYADFLRWKKVQQLIFD
jgi:hypothetical protein